MILSVLRTTIGVRRRETVPARQSASKAPTMTGDDAIPRYCLHRRDLIVVQWFFRFQDSRQGWNPLGQLCRGRAGRSVIEGLRQTARSFQSIDLALDPIARSA